MSEVVDAALASKPPVSLQTVKNILTKLHEFIEQNSIDSFALQILDKDNSSKKAGCLFFEAEVEVCNILKGIENEGAAVPADKGATDEGATGEGATDEQTKEGNVGNVENIEEVKVNNASTDGDKNNDETEQVKEGETDSKEVKGDESKKEAKEEKKPALKKINKFKEPAFGKKKGKPELDWMKKKKGVKVNPAQDKKEDEDSGAKGAKHDETAAKEEITPAANAEVKVEVKTDEKKEETEVKTEEKHEENTEAKIDDLKTEENVEEKNDAKVDDKSGEKENEKSEENANEKSEEKNDGETKENADEKSEDKAPEAIEEKTEVKAEENLEKEEEKIEVVAVETQEVEPEEKSEDNSNEEKDVTTSDTTDEKINVKDEDETDDEKRRRLSSHLDVLEQQGNIGFTVTPKITIQEESIDETNEGEEEILPVFKLKPFYKMPKFKFPGAEEFDSDDEGNVFANDGEKKEKQYGYHIRVSGELDDLNEEEINDEDVFERSGSFTYDKFFESYTTRHPMLEKTGDLSDGVDDAELDYINKGRTYHSRKARKLRLSRLKEENALEAVIDLLDSIRYKPSIANGKHSRYRTSSSSSIISF